MHREYYFFENLFNLNMLTESIHLYEYFDIKFERIYLKTIFLYLSKDSLSQRQLQTGSNKQLEANCITPRLPFLPLGYPDQANAGLMYNDFGRRGGMMGVLYTVSCRHAEPYVLQ